MAPTLRKMTLAYLKAMRAVVENETLSCLLAGRRGEDVEAGLRGNELRRRVEAAGRGSEWMKWMRVSN